MNTLFYGDNLYILREHVADESVDLIYLDPPFNSKATYNVLFKERTGEASAAQIRAFEDTWHWGEEAERAYTEIMDSPIASSLTKEMVGSLRKALGDRNDMTAYLLMMAVRLLELRRVLKPTGSLYLHCDPTASHYIKIIMDSVFGYQSFRNEIIWRRINAKGLAFTRLASNHDVIMRYSKSDKFIWNPEYATHEPTYVEKFYRFTEPETGRRYTLGDLGNPNRDRPNLTYKFLGVTRVWRWTKERMQAAYDQGLIVQSKPEAIPRLKRYLDEQEGNPIDYIWTDIRPIQAQAKERLGYPTQKPLALLERIIQTSSNEGDVVLDPFCGCGTAVAAAHKLNRQWLGIDITHLAVALMKHRLKDMFNLVPGEDYQVIGEPVDVTGARQLAQEDRYQFQYWALSLLEARPEERKKGADRGVDGTIFFIDGPRRTSHKVVIQVKSGHVAPTHVRDLKGVVEREGAALGFFITLEEPTRDMTTEAASAGFFHSDLMSRDYPEIQIRTIKELLGGRAFEMPLRPVQFQQAQRVRRQEGVQAPLANQGIG
ncbi:MAG: restriction endonuclease [Chloroflexi bacterium]|nr:restriction endonuclease [Chloroflexota bacterium]